MGIYINPRNETKESFLLREGREITSDELCNFTDWDGGWRPVILVDNGFMTAAAVMYNAAELKWWCEHPDGRPKKYYMVPTEKLKEVVGDFITR